MDRRAFVWRLLGALAAPAVCWRPPGMEPLTDPTLGISMRFIKAFEPLQFHGDAFALAMEPPNREPLRFGQLYDPERWG